MEQAKRNYHSVSSLKVIKLVSIFSVMLCVFYGKFITAWIFTDVQ